MNLIFENIGMIDKANLKMDGITLIGGENDAGKSTVGKLLYSVIQACDKSDVEQLFTKQKRKDIERVMEEIFSMIRSEFAEKENVNRNIAQTRFFFHKFIINNIDEDYNELLEDSLRKNMEKFETTLDFTLTNKEEIYEKMVKEISNIVSKTRDDNQIHRDKFRIQLQSAFDEDICNKYSEGKSNIILTEDDVKILDIVIEKNKLSEFKLIDEVTINDATFVESPTILELSEAISKASTLYEYSQEYRFINDRPFVNIRMKDLITKLRQPDLQDESMEDLSEGILNIIKGNISYNKELNSFTFKKEGESFDVSNTASGIKAFGIIQMLLKKGFLNKRSIIILDEPEVNLHPKWQIDYAKLLISLVEKTNVKVLITSHSPYFIEAIKVFGDKSTISNKVNFYMAEKEQEEPTVNIIDVTDNLQDIFIKLSEPLARLEEIEYGDQI